MALSGQIPPQHKSRRKGDSRGLCAGRASGHRGSRHRGWLRVRNRGWLRRRRFRLTFGGQSQTPARKSDQHKPKQDRRPARTQQGVKREVARGDDEPDPGHANQPNRQIKPHPPKQMVRVIAQTTLNGLQEGSDSRLHRFAIVPSKRPAIAARPMVKNGWAVTDSSSWCSADLPVRST